MANVTYLLGAGASCEALPTYQNFSVRFKRFVDIFLDSRFLQYVSLTDRSTSEKIALELKKISGEFNYHSTPDTLAKKYFHQFGKESEELIEYKFFLSLFFLHEQSTNSKSFLNMENDLADEKDLKNEVFDKRYDALIASILKPIQNKIDILPNFKILTWNYDLQFEIAFMNYFRLGLSEVQFKINSFPKIGFIRNEYDQQISSHIKPEADSASEKLRLDEFSVIHLNGICFLNDFFKNESTSDLFKLNSFSGPSARLSSYIKIYTDFKNLSFSERAHSVSTVSFAWENQNSDFNVDLSNATLQKAIEVAEQTDILIVIGYSFPIFNDPIDRTILGKMPVKEIYVQSPTSGAIVKKLQTNLIRNRVSDHFYYDLGYWNSFSIPPNWNSKKEDIGFQLSIS